MDMKTLSTTAVTCIAWLGLTGASGAVTMVHAEDSFDGHRLFFTEAQRKQATLKEPDISPDSLPGASSRELANASAERDASTGERAKVDSVDQLETPQRRLSTVRHEDSAIDYDVYFTGLVTGRQEPRVLVNGLPCEPAAAQHSGKSGQPVPINCHGVRNDDLRLTLSTGSGKLLVTDRAGRVHHLLPGKGM